MKKLNNFKTTTTPTLLLLLIFIATSCSSPSGQEQPTFNTPPTTSTRDQRLDFQESPTSILTQSIYNPSESSTESNPTKQVIDVSPSETATVAFDADRAMRDVEYQVSLGPRLPGSEAHEATQAYILDALETAGWATETQISTFNHKTINNLIGKKGIGEPWIILGAHYDTRIFADRDPDPNKRTQPVLGANDGASGVGVLLEIARTLPDDLAYEIWLVFFDAEDNGNIPEWEWIMGSIAFANQLHDHPDKVVVVDMIGDKNLNILWEQYSTPELVNEIWQTAEGLGYSNYFINAPGRTILDDHVPFLNAGISAVDIIDIDYPYWHTTEDTLDKVSSRSLEVVGKTLYHWLINMK